MRRIVSVLPLQASLPICRMISPDHGVHLILFPTRLRVFRLLLSATKLVSHHHSPFPLGCSYRNSLNYAVGNSYSATLLFCPLCDSLGSFYIHLLPRLLQHRSSNKKEAEDYYIRCKTVSAVIFGLEFVRNNRG